MAGEIRMSLTRETIIRHTDYIPGDTKIVTYNIIFTANQLVEPSQDIGWFLLNGAVISQATYPLLYARYGTTFNIGGEGAGNFRLPNFTDGVIPLPKGITTLTAFGSTGGEINHTLTVAEWPSHTHSDTFSITVSPHTHGLSASVETVTDSHYHSQAYGTTSVDGGGSGTLGDNVYTGVASTTTSSSTHTHGFSMTVNSNNSGAFSPSGSISSAGSGGSHSNLQPYQVFGGWLVKHD